jgi:hypothetical protein
LKAFEAECAAHHSSLTNLDQFGQQLCQSDHYASPKIIETLNHLHRLWDELLQALRTKQFKLKQLSRFVALMRDFDEIHFWIADKESEIVKGSQRDVTKYENELEWIESEKRKYEEIQKDLRIQEPKVLDLCSKADELIETSDGAVDNGEIRVKQRELVDAWNRLKALASQRQEVF